MQGVLRKVVYVSLFEAIAIVVSSFGLAAMSGHEVTHAGALAVMSSVMAIAWNLVFNTAFEWWEARQVDRRRTVRRRIAHAVCFELGLVAMLLPVFAWWLNVSLWQALVMDIGLMLFFLVYTFTFNWCFDRVFGLPKSALPA